MASLTAPGQALEGSDLAGHSRDPLRARGLVMHNAVKCYRFVASFDVRAKITTAPPMGQPRIEPTASISPLDEIICKKATIHSLTNKPSLVINKGSHTHKANYWTFGAQTAARIDFSHPSIAGANDAKAIAAKKVP